MGQIADFFIASDSELGKVLPGWKLPRPPLLQPNVRQAVNPFTGGTMDLKSYVDPNGGPADSDAAEEPALQESGGRFDWKWVTELELALLVEVAHGVDEEEARKITSCEALWGPPAATASVFRVPVEVVELLAEENRELNDLANRLAVSDEGLFDRSAEDFGELLVELQQLATLAKKTQRSMFLHVSGA